MMRRRRGMYRKTIQPSRSYLDWLAGFIDGDGSIYLSTYDNCPKISIFQSGDKGLQLLKQIQSNLGIGNICTVRSPGTFGIKKIPYRIEFNSTQLVRELLPSLKLKQDIALRVLRRIRD
jgi:hypothetical protein